MKVSLSWLKEYVDVDLTPEALAEQLDMTGTAVEGIHYYGQELEKIVVGRIKRIKAHPGADKLTVCEVDVGQERLFDIVCGAPNVEEEAVVPVALVGASLPGGFAIKKAKIRGAISEGMMCSEAELGLGEDTSGLMILAETAPIGEKISKFLELEDAVLELEITPNRPDCLGMIGVAREIAAAIGGDFRVPVIDYQEANESAQDWTQVEILDADLCPRYTAKVIKEVEIKHSPSWMQQRLEKAGVRPINNIVDITNYVMLETSQPLHAFDYDKLGENRIVVRKAGKGEVMVSLDGVTRQLNETMLVIADANEPVALAGIMGGFYSEVSSRTTSVLLESAHFNPSNIMRTSRNLGMQSEAAARFEKGVDPNGTVYAANRAAQLMTELGVGRPLKGQVDAYPKRINPAKVAFSTARANRILGTKLSKSKITGIFNDLELQVVKTGQKRGRAAIANLEVSIPTFRPDLEREIDLIEEIVRLHGYNKVKSTLPESSGKRGGLTARQKQERQTRDFLVSAGLTEVISYGFISPGELDKLGLPEDSLLRQVVELLNPLSGEQSIMRTTLIPGILSIVRHNVNREQENVQIFEMGGVFESTQDEMPEETLSLAGALTGKWSSDQWYVKAEETDLFDVKGILDALFRYLNVSDWHLMHALHPAFHSGRCAEIIVEQQVVGIFGEIHPKTQRAYDLAQRVQVFEMNLDALFDYVKSAKPFREIPRFPGISLDIALEVDEHIRVNELEKVIIEKGGGLLKSVHLFDLYQGEQLEKGKKSVAYSLYFRADDRTLDLEEIKRIHSRIVKKLKELGAELRS